MTEQMVAIKMVKNYTKSEYATVKLLREIQIMRNLQALRSDFTPELYELIESKDDQGQPILFMVMEYFESDLAELIKLGKKSGISQMHVTMIIYNTICAMKFLHSANVIHRDIKPSNILINKLC